MQWTPQPGAAAKTLGVFMWVCNPAFLKLPDAPLSAAALKITVSMGAKMHIICDGVYSSTVSWGHGDMQLIPPMSDAEALAAALGPHLEEGQLELALEIGKVQ